MKKFPQTHEALVNVQSGRLFSCWVVKNDLFMSRRSSRLESAGYYDNNRRPLIVYRETPHRIFRTRKGNFRAKTQITVTDSNNNGNNSSDHTMFSWKIFGFLFLFLPLCFGKRSRTNPENDYPHSNIKRARRAEVNYLPNFPRGENETTLEEMRVQIIQETEKTERDQILIEKLMHTTFALRRQHIVQGSPQVREFLENWPALQMQSQVFAEFHRITNVNLRNQFYCELDRYTPKLAALYRQKSSRTGKGAEALREMLRIYDLEEEHDINMRRTLALRALPVYLREDDTEFFKTCNGEDEVEITDTQLALLSVVPDSIGSISFSPGNISIVIEDEVVISELPRLADAFVVLFGLIYVLHLDYPKKLTHTFTFIQKVLMCLDDNKPLKPCLLSLKNDLLKE
uniref:Sterile alpha motif domain-containing protein 3 n=1 Tax=Larimichthys crocea TaxID=215358 RepID=A0A0F8AUA9_LARCR